jgi:hypothetical protein
MSAHRTQTSWSMFSSVHPGGVVGIIPDTTTARILAKHSAAIQKIVEVLKARVTLKLDI